MFYFYKERKKERNVYLSEYCTESQSLHILWSSHQVHLIFKTKSNSMINASMCHSKVFKLNCLLKKRKNVGHPEQKWFGWLHLSIDPCKQTTIRRLTFSCHSTQSVFNLVKINVLTKNTLLANTDAHTLQLYALMPGSCLLLFIMSTST